VAARARVQTLMALGSSSGTNDAPGDFFDGLGKFFEMRIGPALLAMHTGANAKAAWASPFCFPIAARGSDGVSIDAKSSV
jgi:hypothetical protein